MREQFRQITINFAPVNVVGVPGLVLVLIAIALVVQFPEARWLMVAGVGGGVVIAAVLVLGRRRRIRDDPRHGPNGPLMLYERPSTRSDRPSSGSPNVIARPRWMPAACEC